jgi:hypothetical protein
MIYKCPECGIEYSYGRNLCHVCNDNTIFFGSLFTKRNPHKWNCEDTLECIDKLEQRSETDGYENKEIILEVITSHQWNCLSVKQ